ncbi:NAD(P)H-binding protein (plasmid) [Embleya sp. NBC_00888]|uniref:NAD(P)-dependent oxidoreductase n=1 Tax=Embleya sp. NBC_00888 TaxID=2975960 RepID=UPI002F919A55|nr:NAD(P)H-binding protein [Embleya sp. NBC_00888]
MKIAVLGSTGQTGRLVITRALERGHDVTALARRPEQPETPASPNLRVVRADVTDAGTVAAAIEGADVVISALGITKKQDPAILIDGARQIASAAPRVIWLTSLGSGPTDSSGMWSHCARSDSSTTDHTRLLPPRTHLLEGKPTATPRL